ncbi:MAG: pyridoxamine 5'-phosphate oxidase [Bacteroidota bacterium]
MKSKYTDIRDDYDRQSLRLQDLDSSPFWQLKLWLEEAIKAGDLLPTAMSLATVDSSGQPTQRIVLLKDVSDDGISFFTNYNSSKGSQLAYNSKVSANLFWPLLERQVRWEGRAVKISEEVSDNYFASRPRESRIGAWASPQSEKVSDDEVLKQRFKDFEKKFYGQDVPRPPHWGGYIIIPHKVEFWQGRPNRMHQRFIYCRQTSGNWEISQLAP